MSKVYVIGEIREMYEINRVCKALEGLNHKVRCVKPIETTYEDAVHACFRGIEWCDVLVALAKPDGSTSESVTHELCFAEYLGKPTYIIQRRNFSNI